MSRCWELDLADAATARQAVAPLRRDWSSCFSALAPAKRGASMLTSNRSCSDWGSILGDPIIAAAIPDWLLHRPANVSMRGGSYRLTERRKGGRVRAPGSGH